MPSASRVASNSMVPLPALLSALAQPRARGLVVRRVEA